MNIKIFHWNLNYLIAFDAICWFLWVKTLYNVNAAHTWYFQIKRKNKRNFHILPIRSDLIIEFINLFKNLKTSMNDICSISNLFKIHEQQTKSMWIDMTMKRNCE